MARWQYPATVEPVFTGAAPAVVNIGWWQQASVPLFAKILPVALIASGMVAPISIRPETTTVDRWYQPLSLPTPVRPGLPAYQQQAYTAPVSIAPETTSVDRWYQQLSLPTPPKPGLPAWQQLAYTAPVSIRPETTSVDRWYQPLSLYPGAKPGLPASEQQALAWNPFTPSSVVVPSYGWFEPLSTPVIKPPALPGVSVGPISLAAETTTVDRWYQQFSLPIWRRDMLAAEQAAFWWSGFTPTPVSIGWDIALSEPWPAPRGLGVASQQAFWWSGFTPATAPSSAGWYMALSEPYPAIRGLAVAQQKDFWWSGFTPAATPVINSAGWYVALSQPYPAVRSVAWQQPYTGVISLEPGPPPPPPPPPPPTPGEGVGSGGGGQGYGAGGPLVLGGRPPKMDAERRRRFRERWAELENARGLGLETPPALFSPEPGAGGLPPAPKPVQRKAPEVLVREALAPAPVHVLHDPALGAAARAAQADRAARFEAAEEAAAMARHEAAVRRAADEELTTALLLTVLI